MNEGVEVVPSEIWLEILRRTTAADLHRLKAVCKTLNVLISGELFVQRHLIISTDPQPPYHKIYDPDKRRMSVWCNEPRFDDCCSHPELLHRHWVIDSCRGILLVQICNRVLLYNPITKSHKFLPLLFSDLSKFGCWKFAYDDVSEQYKVFGLRRNLYRSRVLLYVVDVRGDNEDVELRSHRKLDDSEITVFEITKDSVLVNGNVYWLVITIIEEVEEEEVKTRTGTCIVSANLTTEEVKTRICFSTPNLFMDINYNNVNNVFAANGTFYQFGRSYDRDFELQLWVLEGFEIENPNPNPSWRMKHSIDYNHCSPNSILSNYPYYITRVVGMFRDKLLIMIPAGKCPDQLYQYDFSREEFEQVTVVAGDDGNIGQEQIIRASKSYRVVEHVDSLISM